MEIEEIVHSTRTPWKSHTLWTMERHWITFPFIIAAMAWLMSARGGWVSNLIVYPKSIDAAQISNLVNNYGSLIPVLAAIIVDSFFGCFSVIWISSFISLLVMVDHSVVESFAQGGRTEIMSNKSNI